MVIKTFKRDKSVNSAKKNPIDTSAINDKIMWDFFKSKGLNDFGIAGLMGNLYAESGLRPTNLQGTYEKTLKMSDTQYTAAVDNGSYTNFVRDKAGYGLAQWTYWSLKQELLNYCKERKKSIGDGETQMEFLVHQLSTSYKSVWTTLQTATSILEASNAVLLKFERPANQSEAVQNKRAQYGKVYYDKYADKEESAIKIPKERSENKMKYSATNKPLCCMQTNSSCYKGTSKMTIKGVLWHSTGANNPNLKRYVQPSDNAPDRDEWIKILGKNSSKNDWNHVKIQAGLNCWIGKLADGTVTTIQTMPWDYKPWGCGSGSKGSCNNGWIQFEICEGELTDKSYFEKVYKEACEITAYLCDLYNIDPNGTVEMNGATVPTILCHADAHKLGLGSNHGDVNHWFPKHGKSMATVRSDVAKLMNKSTSIIESNDKINSASVMFQNGDPVSLVAGATYADGKKIPNWLFKTKLYVRSDIREDNTVIFSTVNSGPITGVIKINNLIKYNETSPSVTTKSQFKPYLVRINVDVLNVRAGAGTNYKVTTQVKKNGLFTIVDENGEWGKLKSGAGWIHLGYTKKIS